MIHGKAFLACGFSPTNTWCTRHTRHQVHQSPGTPVTRYTSHTRCTKHTTYARHTRCTSHHAHQVKSAYSRDSWNGSKPIVIIPVYTTVHSCSVNHRKLCVGIKYYTVHMYSMSNYAYGSTTNFLVL